MAGSITWCVTGASGQLGSVLVRELVSQGQEVLALSGTRSVQIAGVASQPVDITDTDTTRRLVAAARPGVIVHLAAVASAAVVLRNPQRAHEINVQATAALVDMAGEIGARFVHASTDLVFDGTGAPYAESARPNPLSRYGRTKLDSEGPVLAYGRGVVVRPSLMFGLPAVPQRTTFCVQLAALRDASALPLFEDEFRTALWLDDAARALAAIGRLDVVGLLHLAGPERISRLAMGLAMADALGLSTEGVRAVPASSMASAEPRPADVSLDGSLLHETFPDLPPFLTVGQATGGISRDQLDRLGGA